MGEGFKEKFNFKKYLPYVVGAVVVIAVIILLVSMFAGGPKKAVKKYISAMNKGNAEKMVKVMDFKGEKAWKYSYDVDDFSEDDYEEFIDNYEDIDNDDIKDIKKEVEEDYEDRFDDIDDEYKSYKVKVEEFKSVDKLGKDLYVVKAKVSVKAKPEDKDEDEIDSSSVLKFVVYKNKIVYSNI